MMTKCQRLALKFASLLAVMLRSGMPLLLMVAGGRMASGQNLAVIVQMPATKLETFAAKKGTLLATETYFVAVIFGENSCNIRMQAIILYEAGREAEKVRGLRVEVINPANKNDREIVSYVDLDELDGLSSAITSMLDMTRKGKELSFSTVGGLTITMSQRANERHLFVSDPLQTSSVCIVTRGSSIVQLKTSIEKVLQGFR